MSEKKTLLLTEREETLVRMALNRWEAEYIQKRKLLRQDGRQPDWNMCANYQAMRRVQKKLMLNG